MKHEPAGAVPATSRFADTRWSVVREALGGNHALARPALLELCLQYWSPVYTYLRRCGHPPATAADICVAFFEDLLRSPALLEPAGAHVRFREFLLEALHRFLDTDWRDTAERGQEPAVAPPLGAAELESRHRQEPGTLRPAHAFQRSYALALIEGAYRRLQREASQAGREAMFEALAPYLGAEAEPGALELIAQRLGTRPLVLSLALKRLRQRFQELVEEEVAQTVGSDADTVQERMDLLAILR
ncbi:hypothetical protein [Pseudoxanthomonas daejeonensis]|jgi:hypothetical protein|uniref:hypothetical protein n=1 Tax=Pseudoxanthomonas daejeonensis TaxID=266062 RepID=UPI001390FA89|nr:hypothetical protein [Pseudoxanthomonas daejeonensis]